MASPKAAHSPPWLLKDLLRLRGRGRERGLYLLGYRIGLLLGPTDRAPEVVAGDCPEQRTTLPRWGGGSR